LERQSYKMLTTVLNLRTQRELIYTLPAVQAVICAFEQAENGNFNTWGYKYHDHPLVEFGPSGKTVFCGDFAAIIKS
jgi:hypothetical protein